LQNKIPILNFYEFNVIKSDVFFLEKPVLTQLVLDCNILKNSVYFFSENRGSMREISEEMYHRLYRLMKRKIAPTNIAHTLHLPLRTVEHIINRMKKSDDENLSLNKAKIQKSKKPGDEKYLDIYLYTKTRYSIIQLVGALTEQYCERLEKELQKVLMSSWKAIALEMSDLSLIEEPCSNLIISYYPKFQEKDKFLAILNPSPAIDSQLIEFKLEDNIPIFGTELAFEENAFKKKINSIKKRNTR
jgi:anti-anti-sigma regulatory factor